MNRTRTFGWQEYDLRSTVHGAMVLMRGTVCSRATFKTPVPYQARLITPQGPSQIRHDLLLAMGSVPETNCDNVAREITRWIALVVGGTNQYRRFIIHATTETTASCVHAVNIELHA